MFDFSINRQLILPLILLGLTSVLLLAEWIWDVKLAPWRKKKFIRWAESLAHVELAENVEVKYDRTLPVRCGTIGGYVRKSGDTRQVHCRSVQTITDNMVTLKMSDRICCYVKTATERRIVLNPHTQEWVDNPGYREELKKIFAN